ncbi:epimerase [Skermanella stibiiresistens SB22]|uniref:Epimerase n=1 Tax=Skermanella stibiiresistens SB22 TaxID=1385369 RepID=W9HBS9_9PROT|nr:epimerase [Skermanella stibiiresistens SB22]
MLPLWLLPRLLPCLRGAAGIVALGSTSVLAKSDSADPEERAVARRLGDAESAIASFCAEASIPWTILRPTLIHDGHRDANVTAIARFIERFGFFPVGMPASGLRQPIHADDVAGAIVAALDNPLASGRLIDLPGGETLTYREMVRRIFLALDRPVRILPLPAGLLAQGIGLARRVTGVAYSPALFARMNQDLAFDGGDAVRLLGYAAQPFRPRFRASTSDGSAA